MVADVYFALRVLFLAALFVGVCIFSGCTTPSSTGHPIDGAADARHENPPPVLDNNPTVPPQNPSDQNPEPR